MANLSNWIKPSRWTEFQNVKIGILPRFEDNGFKDTDFDRLIGPDESPFHHPIYDLVFDAIDDAMTECEHNIESGAKTPIAALDGAFYFMASFASFGRDTRNDISPKALLESAESQMVMLFATHQAVLAYWKRLDDDADLREYASWGVMWHIVAANHKRREAEILLNNLGGRKKGPPDAPQGPKPQ